MISTPSLADIDIRSDGVAVITLNRPQARNAWGPTMAAQFYTHLDQAVADPDVRVIVVTGAGRAFCAGADLSGDDAGGSPPEDLGDGIASTDDDALAAIIGDRQPYSLTTAGKPVIAAINGACAGIGLTLALMCDIRFASESARFTTAFVRRGLVAEQGISWALPRVVGTAAALELLLSGRRFDADEARERGMLTAVHPDDELLSRVLDYAADIAQNCSPWAMSTIKAQVYDDHLSEAAAATDASIGHMRDSLTRPDVVEGITSFFEKRPPNFPPL